MRANPFTRFIAMRFDEKRGYYKQSQIVTYLQGIPHSTKLN